MADILSLISLVSQPIDILKMIWDCVAGRVQSGLELDENMEELKEAMEALNAVRTDFEQLSRREQTNQGRNWLSRVAEVGTKVDILIKRQENKSFCLGCSFGFFHNYRISKEAVKLLQKVKELTAELKLPIFQESRSNFPSTMAKVTRTVLFGGVGGSPFDMGVVDRIKGIRIGHGVIVDSITILYELKGDTQWTAKHGGDGGTIDEFTLEKNEIITSLSGSHGLFYDYHVVQSLTFTTNRTTYGPYGIAESGAFSIVGNIVSLFGRSGLFLDSIGAYYYKL